MFKVSNMADVTIAQILAFFGIWMPKRASVKCYREIEQMFTVRKTRISKSHACDGFFNGKYTVVVEHPAFGMIQLCPTIGGGIKIVKNPDLCNKGRGKYLFNSSVFCRRRFERARNLTLGKLFAPSTWEDHTADICSFLGVDC